MAKYETRLTGDLNALVHVIQNEILSGSASATLEDQSDCVIGNVSVAVRVFERYSMLGQNRVSLSVTLAAAGEDIFLSAITSGGSQAVVFKINTFGESAFLEQLYKAVERYRQGRR